MDDIGKIEIPKFDPDEIKEDKSIQPERTPELLAFELSTIRVKLREERNKLLLASDKYMLLDYPIGPDKLILIKEYRQQLRDYMDVIDNMEYTQPIPDIPKFPF